MKRRPRKKASSADAPLVPVVARSRSRSPSHRSSSKSPSRSPLRINTHSHHITREQGNQYSPQKSSSSSLYRLPTIRIQNETTSRSQGGPFVRSLLSFRRFFFAFGIVLGALVTLHFGQHIDLPGIEFNEYKKLVDGILGDVDIQTYLPDLGLADLKSIGQHYTDFITRLPTTDDLFGTEDAEFHPGAKMALAGLHAKHPVVMIPGIVSTGLEVWNTHPHHQNGTSDKCGLKYFRKRMWGTMNQLRAVLLDKNCWLEHMMLDKETGLDPPGVKLRAAQGLGAADYLFPGYWVWARIISNLAAIGYDSNNMHLAAYDWRLAYSHLEKRDLYFSRLKSTIELAYLSSQHQNEFDRKVVIVSHSMGSNLFFYFLQWIQSVTGGKGGKNWPDKYLASWANIGGPVLGSPKSIPPVISGEMRDTVQMNAFSTYILDTFFSKKERSDLFQSWGGLPSMFLMGGNRIWGDEKGAPDDLEDTGRHGNYLEFDQGSHLSNATVDALYDRLGDLVGPHYVNKLSSHYHYGIAETQKDLLDARDNATYWLNPLLSPLPRFSSVQGNQFKIYCLYGVGKETERKYYYKQMSNETQYFINTDIHDPSQNITNGVLLTDGSGNPVSLIARDATVPLVSNGYMCIEGWKRRRYNPSDIKVVTREFKDGKRSITQIRGGPESADHVDIMGNVRVIGNDAKEEFNGVEDLLRIVSGTDQDLTDDIISDIRRIADRIQLPQGLDNE